MMNIDLSDNVYNKYIGMLSIEEIHDNGSTKIHHSPNVITYDARTIMSYLLVGEEAVNKFVKYLKVGNDNTTPTRNDTGLITLADTLSVTYTHPDVDRVVIEAILPNITAANGTTLREAGLFNNDGQMFSRQVHGDIAKTSSLQLKYIWTIIFT